MSTCSFLAYGVVVLYQDYRIHLISVSPTTIQILLETLYRIVLFQISSHVKAIDAIYQGTDFMGIRNISFMVKRIRVSVAHFRFSLMLWCVFLLNLS